MKRLSLVLAALLPLTGFAVQPIVIYTIRDLGTLGGTIANGNAINASGVVAGTSYLEDNTMPNAFISEANGGGPLRSLGTLGGPASLGAAVNSTGMVAGSSQIEGNTFYHAFVSGPNGGSLVDLAPDSVLSHAYGVNGAGQVVGDFVNAGATHAFISASNGGALTDLGTLGGTSSFANGVNASGQVTGYSQTGDVGNPNHAFLSEVNGGVLHDLGTLGGTLSVGNAVNDAGQVVGRSTLPSLSTHAFRSAPNGGPLLDLGTLSGSSEATAINNAGDVVGRSGSSQHAFIYTTKLGLMDLNNLIAADSGWLLTDAKGINDSGLITGTGTIIGENEGQTHVFLLTPIPPAARITSIKKLSNGHLLIEGIGTPLETLTVETTTDLEMGFQPLTTIMAGADGSLSFEDPAPTPPRRFYRFVYP